MSHESQQQRHPQHVQQRQVFQEKEEEVDEGDEDDDEGVVVSALSVPKTGVRVVEDCGMVYATVCKELSGGISETAHYYPSLLKKLRESAIAILVKQTRAKSANAILSLGYCFFFFFLFVFYSVASMFPFLFIPLFTFFISFIVTLTLFCFKNRFNIVVLPDNMLVVMAHGCACTLREE